MTDIERIDAVDFLKHLPHLRAHCQPAVVTGLFTDSSLAALSNVRELRERFGGEPLSVGTNYIDLHLERVRRYIRGVAMPGGLARRETTVNEVLDLLAGAEGRQIVTEQPTVAALLEDIDLSALGVRTIVGANVDPYAETSPETAYSLMFIAGSGNSSDLHMDGDGRDVLLYQAFGHKRVCLFPASAAPVLHPVGVFSTVRLAAMGDHERRAFLDYAGGVEHVLSPGETVFMPAFIWHHLDYLDVSMSVSFRFGGIEEPLGRELIRTVHLDHYVSRIIAGTRDPESVDDCRAAASRVLSVARQRHPSARAAYRAVRIEAASQLPGRDQRQPDAYIDIEDFLEGGLAGFYSRRGAAGRRQARVPLREKARDVVRRQARKLAYWA